MDFTKSGEKLVVVADAATHKIITNKKAQIIHQTFIFF